MEIFPSQYIHIGGDEATKIIGKPVLIAKKFKKKA
jgi:N-acetyl-beta-hexosaminidase